MDLDLTRPKDISVLRLKRANPALSQIFFDPTRNDLFLKIKKNSSFEEKGDPLNQAAKILPGPNPAQNFLTRAHL